VAFSASGVFTLETTTRFASRGFAPAPHRSAINGIITPLLTAEALPMAPSRSTKMVSKRQRRPARPLGLHPLVRRSRLDTLIKTWWVDSAGWVKSTMQLFGPKCFPPPKSMAWRRGRGRQRASAISWANGVPDLSSITNDIVVSSGGTVQRAMVTLSITHPFDSDLDISVESPQGTMIVLSNDNGADLADYTGTIFDDNCQTSIVDGIPPFTGCFIPQESLATFNGTNPNGTWKLHVTDDAIIDGGVLTAWSVALCITP
jgi:subtilisin-like proprotein convertase family protein